MVGAALKRGLESQGYENIVTRTHSELDLVNQADVEAFFNAEKPEYVMLAAAKVGGILANDTYKAEFIYANMMIAANVVHSSYKHGVKKLLNLGSSCIYPRFAEQPMKEEYLLSGSLEPTNEPYAVAKISALKLCRYYNEQYGTNYISVMPTNLYGPNDNFNLETAHVMPAIMRKLHLAKLLRNRNYQGIINDLQGVRLGFDLDLRKGIEDTKAIEDLLGKVGVNGDHIIIWGRGDAYREFLHVDDLADACIYLMANCDYNDIGEFINIGIGKDIMIKDLADLLRENVGFEGEIKHDLSRPGGTPRKLLDVSKMKSLGWKARYSLKEGIEKSYEWYCMNSSTNKGSKQDSNGPIKEKATEDVKTIKDDNEILAIVVRNNHSTEGLEFFTPDEFSQQLAYMNHKKGKIIRPHSHISLKREIRFTQEVLFIKSGRLRVDLYKNNQTFHSTHILSAGDTILLAGGGHGFEVLDDIEMIEVKQGPYAGDMDKTHFEGKNDPGQ